MCSAGVHLVQRNFSLPCVFCKNEWTTADNADTPVTANDLKMIIAAVAVRSNKLHTAYRIAKENVEAATTATEVEAVAFEI